MPAHTRSQAPWPRGSVRVRGSCATAKAQLLRSSRTSHVGSPEMSCRVSAVTAFCVCTACQCARVYCAMNSVAISAPDSPFIALLRACARACQESTCYLPSTSVCTGSQGARCELKRMIRTLIAGLVAALKAADSPSSVMSSAGIILGATPSCVARCAQKN
eukprot:scaffold2428_cov412-Prasinococcus_capsulatus_cf.AAC.14